MLTTRRLATYTHDRPRLTPRQRRRATHKANRLDAGARKIALAAIAALVAGAACGAAGPAKTALTATAGPALTRDPIGRHGAPQTTTTTTEKPRPPAPRVSRNKGPAPTRPPSTPSPAPSAVARGQSLGTFTATCYGAFEGYGGTTASGQQSGPGSIATDPRVIPMGTHLHVEGYGAGVANDVGGAIKGHRIDVWFRSAAECSAWGTRSVEVFAG